MSVSQEAMHALMDKPSFWQRLKLTDWLWAALVIIGTAFAYTRYSVHMDAYEQGFLLTCERGDALIIADQNHVAVKVVASDKEHPLITTNPAELYS